MRCLDCHHDLIRIPTHDGPQLDVCPDRHGLWLDAGEATLFVENYQALEEAMASAAARIVRTESPLCPHCGEPLEAKSVCETALFACHACRGWWCPQGTLTRLNTTAIRTAAQFDESQYYTRAEKRRSLSPSAAPHNDFRHPRSERRVQQVWFWTLFLGGALLVACFMLFAGIRKTVATTQATAAPDAMLAYLVLGVVGGVGLCVYGLVINSRKQLIESIPTSPVRSLAVGLVEVTGRAKPEHTLLRAPFSGLPCVLFSYSVEERQGSGKNTSWKTIAKGTSAEPFYVEDDTGKVLVVPFDAQLMLPDKRTSRTNWLGTLPDATIDGLSKLGIPVDGWFGEKTLRCSEACILPEEVVYVMGTAQEHRAATDSAENAARLYIGSGRDNSFIISDRSEKELLSRLRWQVFASLAGGPALALFCLLVIFKTYGTAFP